MAFMSQVIRETMGVSETVSGVEINGEKRDDIETTGGWGSGVRIQINNQTNEVAAATRYETMKDKIFTKWMVEQLESQFQEQSGGGLEELGQGRRSDEEKTDDARDDAGGDTEEKEVGQDQQMEDGIKYEMEGDTEKEED